MALRCVLNRAKSWSRFVSTNVIPTFGCRYYYLPPPPPYVEPDRDYNGLTRPAPTVGEESLGALSSAQFAVSMSNLLEGRNVKFVRLVRGSQWDTRGGTYGTIYSLTIEGIDESGYRNVYYAEVSDCTSQFEMKLLEWKLVDDMFKYPYSHDIKTTRPVEISPAEMERPDYFRIMSKFEKQVGRSSNEFRDADSVQMCNIIDLEEALHYALYAVENTNEEHQEDGIIHLRKLVYASRIDLDGKIFYHLLIDASSDKTHEVKLYYALVKEYCCEEELIQWREVHNSHKYFTQIGQCA